MTFWDFWTRHPIIGTIVFLIGTATAGDVGRGLRAIAEALRGQRPEGEP